nr:hypothetical protein [Tanacetum cinerariifolium]
MPPPPTPSSSNIMPPPLTPSGSNTMPPPPTPSGSNIMPSHATPSLHTSACSNTMPSHAAFTSTGTEKGKCHLIFKNEADLPQVVLLAAEVVLAAKVEHQFKIDIEALYEMKTEQITNKYEHARIRKMLEDNDEDDQF